MLPLYHLGLRTHRRVHFRLDDRHPVGASQHQKIAVIDDRIAFVGGLDLTASRWDSRAHLPGDEHRCGPDGSRYGPFHDVQMAVDGEAARALVRIAPFTVINLVAGATRVRLRDFVIGTLLVMTPGVLVFTLFARSLARSARDPGWATGLATVALAAGIAAALALLYRRMRYDGAGEAGRPADASASGPMPNNGNNAP